MTWLALCNSSPQRSSRSVLWAIVEWRIFVATIKLNKGLYVTVFVGGCAVRFRALSGRSSVSSCQRWGSGRMRWKDLPVAYPLTVRFDSFPALITMPCEYSKGWILKEHILNGHSNSDALWQPQRERGKIAYLKMVRTHSLEASWAFLAFVDRK